MYPSCLLQKLSLFKNWYGILKTYCGWLKVKYWCTLCFRHAYAVHLKPWQTRTHCCGHIVAHDVSCAAQTGKQLLRTQNVSEQNQKHFMCPGHKIFVRNKCCAHGQTGNICVGNNVSAAMCPRLPPGPLARNSAVLWYLNYHFRQTFRGFEDLYSCPLRKHLMSAT